MMRSGSSDFIHHVIACNATYDLAVFLDEVRTITNVLANVELEKVS
jgi:hypothetical protein